MTRLLRFWFTFEENVERRDYLRHGLALMVLKYGVDASLIAAATSTRWTPLDYLQSVPFLLSSTLSGSATYLAPVLALWTFPFLWIGITMTIRRLIDAGWSAWWSLLFFVPFLSYVLMAVLALVPSGGNAPGSQRTPRRRRERRSALLLAIGVGTALGLGMIWLGAELMNSYGLALFMGTPFCIGLATGYTLCRAYPATFGETCNAVVMTLLLITGAAFALGIEGAVCLLMVAPIGLVIALMGGAAGRFLATAGQSPAHGAALIAVLLPGAATIEAGSNASTIREVRSAVMIDAPPAVVWNEVIAFSPIPEPTSILFKLGLAYPIRAEIKGSGVGAVRYCVFSTGAFVEPITEWAPGERLAFDVIESPPPLKELSFRTVGQPHLEGYLLPRRGEFRLVRLPDGRTRLEGSTWYEQRLRPEGYWVLFSDYVIGRIHQRVLEHIRSEAETGAAGNVILPSVRSSSSTSATDRKEAMT